RALLLLSRHQVLRAPWVDPLVRRRVPGRMRSAILLAACLAIGSQAAAESPSKAYNKSAGVSAPTVEVARTVRDSEGRVQTVVVPEPVAQDRFGNANGNQH